MARKRKSPSTLADFVETRGKRKREQKTTKQQEIQVAEKQQQKSIQKHEKSAKKEQKKLVEKEGPRQFSRMSPAKLCKFFNQMTNEQKKSIEEIGFSHLFHLKVNELPVPLSKWLVSNFDPYRCCLKLKHGVVQLTEIDVEVALGLPRGKNKITQGKKTTESDENTEFLEQWYSQFDSKRDVTLPALWKKIESQKDGGIDFKRNFVILVVNTILKGTQNSFVSTNILRFLYNVDEIKTLNWCAYTLSCLNDSCERWQKKKGKTRFTGPMLFLMLCYMDRVVFKEREIERSFPLIKNWDRERVFKRFYAERDVSGFGYGYGRIEETFKLQNQENDQISPVEKENDDEIKKCVDEVVQNSRELASTFSKFVKSVAKAHDKLPKSAHLNQLRCMVENMMPSEKFDTEETTAEAEYSWEHDKLFDQPELAEVVNAISNLFRGNKEQRKGEETGKKEEGEKKEREEEKEEENEEEEERERNDNDIPCEMDMSKNEEEDTEMKEQEEKQAEEREELEKIQATPISRGVTRKFKRTEGQSAKGLEKEEVETAEEKRDFTMPAIYRSPFRIKNIDVFKGLTKIEKDLSDYAISESDEREQMFITLSLNITRAEIRTIFSENDYLSTKVIDAWCLYLNKNEKKRDVNSPLRYFVPAFNEKLLPFLQTNASADFESMIEKDITEVCQETEEVELIIFPWYKRIFQGLLCLNFNKSRVQVVTLENKARPSMISTEINKLVQALSSSSIMLAKFPKMAKLTNFKIEDIVIPCPGLKTPADKGTQLMRLMESYKGNKTDFEKTIKDSNDSIMKRTKVKYICALLSMEENLVTEVSKIKKNGEIQRMKKNEKKQL